jgi:CubicO group peptidase (beta-lactamase class C family)
MDPATQYHDHFFIYAGAVDAFAYSIASPVEFAPNSVGRYRNSDPMALGFLVRQAVEKRGEEYLTYPQRALFDRIGIRRQVLEPDPWGNFLLSGYDYGTARNWARLGLLYLQDGRVERQAPAARRLGHVCQHARAGVAAKGIRRHVLGERRGASGTCRAAPISWPAPAASIPSSSRRTTWSWCAWVTSAARPRGTKSLNQSLAAIVAAVDAAGPGLNSAHKRGTSHLELVTLAATSRPRRS